MYYFEKNSGNNPKYFMKIKIILLFVAFVSMANAQFSPLQQNQGLLEGGFGLTWINGAPNYAFRIMPEFQFSKIGVGLDLNLEYTASGKLRSEDFN